MADYTHYNSILDPEWVEFSKTSKPPALPKDLTVAKKIFNGQRAKLFKDVLGPVGKCMMVIHQRFTARESSISNTRLCRRAFDQGPLDTNQRRSLTSMPTVYSWQWSIVGRATTIIHIPPWWWISLRQCRDRGHALSVAMRQCAMYRFEC